MKRALLLAAVALQLAGCGGDDEEAAEPVREGRTRPTPPADTAVFRSKAIAFTFRYPEEFAARRKPRMGVLGQVSVDPRGRLNAIQVRRTADRPLAPSRYLDEFRRDFAKAVGAPVEKREERIGGLEAGVLEFADSSERAGKTVEFTSSSYFFAGAGETWQVACVADTEHREQVESACRTVLESVRFKRPGRGRARQTG